MDPKEARTFVVLDQLSEISILELVTSRGKDIKGGIRSKFVYQFASLGYYELVEDSEAEENTNIDVLKEIEENYL
jgi:hypothetical protein